MIVFKKKTMSIIWVIFVKIDYYPMKKAKNWLFSSRIWSILTKITLFITKIRQQSIWAGGVPMHYSNVAAAAVE